MSTPNSSRRVSTFSDSNLTTLESLVLEVALEDAKQHQQQQNILAGTTHHSDPIKECEMSAVDFARIKRLVGNHSCADCENTQTEWASVSFGILLCAECSGVHRAMGTHISRVRSIKMDSWSDEHLELMYQGGNYNFQRYLEKNSHDMCFDYYNTPIEVKYTTDTAEEYKKQLKERVAASAAAGQVGSNNNKLDETESSTETGGEIEASNNSNNNKQSKQNAFQKQQQQKKSLGSLNMMASSTGAAAMDDNSVYSFADDTSDSPRVSSTPAKQQQGRLNHGRRTNSSLDDSDEQQAIQEEDEEDADSDANNDDNALGNAMKSMSLDAWFNTKKKSPATTRRISALPMPSSSASLSGNSSHTTNTIQSAFSSFTSRRTGTTPRRSHSAASAPTITYLGRSFSADGTDECKVKNQRNSEKIRRQSDVKLLAEMATTQDELARENLKQASWRQSAPSQMQQWSADRKVEPFSLNDGSGSSAAAAPVARSAGGLRRPTRHESLRKKLAYTDKDLLKIAMDDKEFARLKAGLKTKGAVTNGILEQKLYAFVAKSKLRENNNKSNNKDDDASVQTEAVIPGGRKRMPASKSENLSMMRSRSMHATPANRL